MKTSTIITYTIIVVLVIIVYLSCYALSKKACSFTKTITPVACRKQTETFVKGFKGPRILHPLKIIPSFVTSKTLFEHITIELYSEDGKLCT